MPAAPPVRTVKRPAGFNEAAGRTPRMPLTDLRRVHNALELQ